MPARINEPAHRGNLDCLSTSNIEAVVRHRNGTTHRTVRAWITNLCATSESTNIAQTDIIEMQNHQRTLGSARLHTMNRPAATTPAPQSRAIPCSEYQRYSAMKRQPRSRFPTLADLEYSI